MKRLGWLLIGLPLAVLAAAPPARGAEKPRALGIGPAYDDLAKVPIMAAGRKKPLDTLAREEVKQLFGRETIKLIDPAREVDHLFGRQKDGAETIAATWGPVAALFDWSVRPEFWDDQPFLLVNYLPLKRLILGEALRARLTAAAERSETTAADRKALQALAADEHISANAIVRFLGKAQLSSTDRKELEILAAKLSEEHKWLTPRELEGARILVDGQKVEFETWFRELAQRKSNSEASMAGPTAKLTDIEKRAIEVGTRLVHYRAFRDREVRSVEPLLVMPRPSNAAYLAFCAKAFQQAKTKDDGIRSLTPLQLDAANALYTYLDILGDPNHEPGTDAAFDEGLSNWLRDNSAWIPLRVFLDTKPQELEEAGFPAKPMESFVAAYHALEQAEEAEPGAVPTAKASSLLAAARALGTAVNPSGYPPVEAMDLEAHFNATNPFFRAPVGYGLAMAILAICLGFSSVRPKTPMWRFGIALYGLGMACLLVGIGLEVLGFSMRVRISGWAPVTNMYETVIWVSLVAAVLGLVFELIFRKVFPALAGASVALLGTVLAANTPLLDPGIRALQPVLRSNYWLTIHVLTEVSSYAAFALAMGLGMIGTLYYLTATYRRSPGFLEVGAPLLPGLPLLALGSFGIAASYGSFGFDLPLQRATLLYNAAGALAAVGGVMTIVGGGGVLGEAVSRVRFRANAPLEQVEFAGMSSAPAATSVQTVTIGEGGSGGAVATLTKPTVSEMRARAAANRPKLDARGLAMQATAAKIKPLSNFIYRTMQVGVLLVAAGTMLGGVWADESWGRFWGWDPKEVWALITLLVYLIPLHGRFAGWVNTFGLVMASVVCFLSVIMAWYGVNFVLGVGLHSYGFVEGGSQGAVGAVVLAVLAVAGAAAWRRWLASRVPASAA